MTDTIIADFPAFKIIAADENRKWKHGDEFAIMFPSRRYGEMPHFFKLGSIFGYAVQNGDDVLTTYANAQQKGHELFWASPQGASISSPPPPKRTVRGVKFGDIIQFEGHKFELVKAPNQNVALREVA